MYKICIRLHRSELLLKFCRDITSFLRIRPTFIEFQFISRQEHQMKTVFGPKTDVDKHDSEATEHSFKTLTTVNEKQSRNKVKFRSRHEQHQMKTVFGTKMMLTNMILKRRTAPEGATKVNVALSEREQGGRRRRVCR